MVRPELITFDCYGTLIDWNAGIAGALRAEGERQGFDVDDATILSAYHAAEPEAQAREYRSYRAILTRLEAAIAGHLGWEPPSAPGYLAAGVGSWTPFEDTNRSLRRLREMGFKLGILSNIDDDMLAATRQHLEVEFDLLVTAQQVRSYKPRPVHFEHAVAAVDGDRGRLLHMAQSHFHDIRPGEGHGIRTVWINRLAEVVPADGPQPFGETPDLQAAVAWLEAELGAGTAALTRCGERFPRRIQEARTRPGNGRRIERRGDSHRRHDHRSQSRRDAADADERGFIPFNGARDRSPDSGAPPAARGGKIGGVAGLEKLPGVLQHPARLSLWQLLGCRPGG